MGLFTNLKEKFFKKSPKEPIQNRQSANLNTETHKTSNEVKNEPNKIETLSNTFILLSEELNKATQKLLEAACSLPEPTREELDALQAEVDQLSAKYESCKESLKAESDKQHAKDVKLQAEIDERYSLSERNAFVSGLRFEPNPSSIQSTKDATDELVTARVARHNRDWQKFIEKKPSFSSASTSRDQSDDEPLLND